MAANRGETLQATRVHRTRQRKAIPIARASPTSCRWCLQLQHKLGRLLTSVLDDIDLIFLAPVPQRSLSVFGFKCIPPLETPFGFKKFLETRVRAPVPKGRRDGRVPMGQLFFGKTKREVVPEVEFVLVRNGDVSI